MLSFPRPIPAPQRATLTTLNKERDANDRPRHSTFINRGNVPRPSRWHHPLSVLFSSLSKKMMLMADASSCLLCVLNVYFKLYFIRRSTKGGRDCPDSRMGKSRDRYSP